MRDRGARSTPRIRPSLRADHLVVFFLLLMPAVIALRGKIGDYDLWWHLAYGRWIEAHGVVPWTDPFSYTAEGRPWMAYSWLAEILFYQLSKRFGLVSLVWLQALVAMATVGFVYLACRAAGARRTVAVVVAALSALGSSFAWGIRPLVFTLLFLSVIVWAIESDTTGRRLVWLAPLVVGLWANLHVLFAGGIALVTWAALARTIEGRSSRLLYAAAGLALVAAFVNPFGPRLFDEVWTMVRQPTIAPEVDEFQSPNFRGEFALGFSAFLFPALVVIALSRERLSVYELGTFFGSLALGLGMQRNMALFAIVGAPTVARRLERLVPASEEGTRTPGRPLEAFHALLLAAGMGYLGSQAPRASEVVEPDLFPIRAADFIAERHLGPRLFNDFNWGGYLIYRLYPEARVSIDGRTPVYEHIMRPYMSTWFLGPGWEQFLDACDPDVVIWPVGAPLAAVLRTRPDWELLYSDELAVVLRRSRGRVPSS